jgi:hypothetical protein
MAELNLWGQTGTGSTTTSKMAAGLREDTVEVEKVH